jgi:hypothetical protein
MPSPGVTITGTIYDITGTANAGTIKFTLVNYGGLAPIITGSFMLAPVEIICQAASDGTFSQVLWGTYQINPSNTFYQVTITSADGRQIIVVGYQFNTAGSFDLSNLMPIAPTPGLPIFQVILPETTGVTAHKWLNSYSASTGLFTAAQPAFTDISGTASTAQIPSLAASKITSGQLALAQGGTDADLSATGGTSQVLKQTSSGAAITVGQLAFTDISGSVAASQLPNPSASTLGGIESIAAVSHKWINTISTSGVPGLTQPAAADLSDTATSGNVLRGNGTSFVSATLAAADLSNGVTGTGAVVLATSPTLVTPTLGVASATTVNKLTITTPASGSTLTILNGKTLKVDNTLELAGVDSTVLTFQGTGTVVNQDSTDTFTNKTLDTAGTGNVLKINGTTVSDITGTGKVVLQTSPSITTPTISSGGAAFSGSSSGSTTVAASATASGTLTLPAATDTLTGKATTDTLTHKTIDTAGTGNHIQIGGNDLPTSIGSTGQALVNTGSGLGFASRTASINFTIDGGGAVPGTGVWGQISIPTACTVTGWVLTGDASGSAVVDVLRATYSGFPTTSSIAGTDKPTLSSAQKNENLSISAWGSTALAAGDQLQVNLNSVTTCQRLNLTLIVTVP